MSDKTRAAGRVDLSTLKGRQPDIAKTLDRPVFVEAGAGSGKTFTLTKRVAWALSPGSGKDGKPFLDSLDQVLVITFTDAAAREIRERVRYELRSSGMNDAALQVDDAWISTIHTMCSRILHRHALDLGLDPSFGMAEPSVAEDMLNAAVDAAIDAVKHEGQATDLSFLEKYGVGRPGSGNFGDSGAFGLIKMLLEKGHALPGGVSSLVAAEPDGSALREAMNDYLARLEETMAVPKLSASAKGKLSAAIEAAQGFGELPPSKRTPAEALSALAPTLPGNIAAGAKEALVAAKSARALARCEACFLQVSPYAESLAKLALLAEDNYDQLKRQENVLDYEDLVRLALSAVQGSEEVRQDYAGRFKLVMVDEFQDTDEMQLALIKLLAGEDASHLCTVGDAQQSIYRFRGADVSVFRRRGREVKEGEGESYRLDINFRSHEDVLSFVERVSTGGDGGHGTMDEFMHLDPSDTRKDGYAAKDLPRIDVEVVGGPSQKTRRGAAAAMASQVADALARYRDHGVSPGKMALLLGVTGNSDIYIDAIRDRGMECVVTGGSKFSSSSEVKLMCNLLYTLANPSDTQSGLFPLLASEMFGLDANDFCDLGTRKQDVLDAPTKRRIDRGLASMEFYGNRQPSARLKRANEVLSRALDQVGKRPIADICSDVVRDSGWLSRLEAQGPSGRARAANVLAAVGYIRDLTESLGLGPARAAVEFERWLNSSKIPPATLADASKGDGGMVEVMTIHASKGLQFNVCAVAECWSERSDSTGVQVLDPDASGTVPFVLKPPSSDKDKTYKDLGKDLKKIDSEELQESADRSRKLPLCVRYLKKYNLSKEADAREKARLLYVALTRAEEALVLCVDARRNKSGEFRSKLAGDVLGALGIDPAFEGTTKLPYGTSKSGKPQAATLNCTQIKALDDDDEDESNAEQPVQDETSPQPFQLYELPAAFDGRVGSWRAREGVFSYSSVHATESLGEGSKDLVPRERKAEEEGSAFADDPDRATNLGSAFHELAQSMVESGSTPTDDHIRSIASFWNLSERATGRLRAALSRWEGSSIRREALSHDRVSAEVPFFQKVSSPHGEYLEGAIDLLATDDGSTSALVVDYKTGDAGLSVQQVRERHAMQASFYAHVLLDEGYAHVDCAFVCVEREDPVMRSEPLVARYSFDA